MENYDEVESQTKGAKITLATDQMTRTKSASGSVSFHCGDAVARALQGLSLPFIKELASTALQIDTTKYDHLNPGQQRMTLGNVIRNMLRRNEELTDGFNDILESVQARCAAATREEREAAEAEKAAKAQAKIDAQALKDQEKADKEKAKADAKALKDQEKAEKAQAKADAKALKEKEAAEKAQAKADAKALKDQEKADKAAAKAAEKRQKELDLAEGESAE